MTANGPAPDPRQERGNREAAALPEHREVEGHPHDGHRVACAGDQRREVPLADLARVLEPSVRERVVRGLKSLGYRYITVDLEGFRSGSLNPPPAGPGRA